MRKAKINTRTMTLTAIFAAISTLLGYLEISLGFVMMPPFLKLDLSAVPILIGAFLLGPLPAIVMTGIKEFVHLLSSTSGGVGQLANFIIIASFSASAGLIYRRKRTQKGAVLACLAGIVVIAVTGVFVNKYLLIPAYSKVMPIDAIISACNAVNPMIDSIDAYIWFGAVPFNIIKGVVISTITFLVYKRLSLILKKQNLLPEQAMPKPKA